MEGEDAALERGTGAQQERKVGGGGGVSKPPLRGVEGLGCSYSLFFRQGEIILAKEVLIPLWKVEV
jgi:hypothetical protein